MFLKFICCDVFTRIACELVAKSPHIIDLDFVPMLNHNDPLKLKRIIMQKIDKSISDSGRIYDAVILGFGLCGNAVIGLSCPVPMVIPRAHDCCTILMGSKEKFISDFGSNLSTRWCSTGYYERAIAEGSGHISGQQLENHKTSAEYLNYVEQYDEETADYLWETLYPRIETNKSVYIKTNGFEYSNSFENYSTLMENQGVDLAVVDGDISLLRSLINGNWDDDNFLTIPPGEIIVGVYDMDQVMKSGRC